jgi:hypothetical protein
VPAGTGERIPDPEKETEMAMVRITPTEIVVGCDPFTGRPRSVRFGEDVLTVTRIERVREETAAYPIAVGPRTMFDVRTAGARLRLSFQHRSRRWLVEGMDTDPLAVAA